MSMTRNQLRQRVARNLGGGMIKTELCVEHYDDAINSARDLWITYAVGNATMEVYFLLLLEGGKYVYDMPAGIIEIISYQDKMGGIGGGGYNESFGGYSPGRWMTGPEMGNTAFHINDQGWQGLGYNSGGYGNTVNGMYTMIDTYMAISHMELIQKMRHDKYQWRYTRFSNQLEIIPTPECGNQLTASEAISGSLDGTVPCSGAPTYNVDSPGYIMLRGQIMEGCTLPTYTPSVSGATDYVDNTSLYPDADANHLEYIYSHPWIIAYSTAYVKQTLGLIRRKFANNTSLGNASISLDGDSLVSEAREDMQRLEEELDQKWSYEGYGIIMG